MPGTDGHDPRTAGRQQARRRRHPHPRDEPDAGDRGLQRPARRDRRRQDDADQADGRPRAADERRGPVPRQERHRGDPAQAQRQPGAPVLHQLPDHDGLREHRLAAQGVGRRAGRDRAPGARDRRPPAPDPDARPPPAGALRRPAAAHRPRPRHRQVERPRAPRRAARQPRLQAARGAARPASRALRRPRRHRRLRDLRAVRGADARRPHRHPRRRPRDPVRPHSGVLPRPGRPHHGAGVLRPADQRRPGREAGRRDRPPRPRPLAGRRCRRRDARRSLHARAPAALRLAAAQRPGPGAAPGRRPDHRALGLRERRPLRRRRLDLGRAVERRPSRTGSATPTTSTSTSATASTSPATAGGSPDGPDRPQGPAPQLPRASARAGRLRAQGDRPRLAGRRRLCAARPLGLRQVDASQHHLGPDRALRGPHPLRRPRRDPPGADRAQHRPGLPVPGHLRHHDRLRQPRLPAQEPRRRARRRRCPRAHDRRDARARRDARPPRRRPHRRRQAEDLDGPRPRARGRQRHHVRRAADRHRPAPEVEAALEAQGAAPARSG